MVLLTILLAGLSLIDVSDAVPGVAALAPAVPLLTLLGEHMKILNGKLSREKRR